MRHRKRSGSALTARPTGLAAIDIGGFVRRNWVWLLVGVTSLAILAGGTAVALTYVDQKSFVKMMDGILKQLGISDPNARLAIIAHAGLETTLGTAGSAKPRQTFNFWNITAGSLWKGKVLDGGDTEYGKTITQKWRVYLSPLESARDYIAFLSATDRKMLKQPDGSFARATASYKDALDKLMAGDAKGFFYTLRDAGYYTLDADQYWAMVQGQMIKARGYLAS